MKKIVLALMVFMIALTGCRKPYKEAKYEVIKPNETAFVIPLEGANKSKQGKFGSIDYLESQKVAAKRIEIPQRWHQSGRLESTGKWISTVKVMKVDRSPVTREWTSDAKTGTTNKNEAIELESKESIGFNLGVTISASVPEDKTARFLYWYSGKQLENIIDRNVRSYVQDFLTKEFSKYNLGDARTKKSEIFTALRDSARVFFAEKGILIENIGAAGQFMYTEKEIQDAINAKFVAEMKVKAADDEVAAAQKFMKARKSIEAQQTLDADIKIKHAYANYLNKWNGVYPTTMAGNLDDLAKMGLATGALK